MDITKEKISFNNKEQSYINNSKRLSEKQKVHLEKARAKRKEKSILKKIEKEEKVNKKHVNTKMDYVKYAAYTFTRRFVLISGVVFGGYTIYYIYNKKNVKKQNEQLVPEIKPVLDQEYDEPICEKPIEKPQGKELPKTNIEKSVLDKLEPI